MAYGSPAWAALIAQIRRDPASAELRDVAADYLIEHGDPRGELIVLRNKLAAGVDPSEYVAVYERHRELERAKPWAAQFEAMRFPNWQQHATFTGFMERAYLDASTFDRLPKLCRCEPIVELACNNLGALPDEQRELPELEDMIELVIDDESRGLLASTKLGKVRRMYLYDPSPAFCEALAASVIRPHRIRLARDDVSRLYRLATSPALDELRELPFDSDDSIATLGDHPLPNLARLETTQLSRASIERMADRLDQLAVLRVGAYATEVLPIVIANVRSGNLRELALRIVERDVDTMVELVDSQACLALESIEIRGVPCPLPIEQALRKLAFHGHLREVTVEARRGGRIRIDGVHVIEAA